METSNRQEAIDTESTTSTAQSSSTRDAPRIHPRTAKWEADLTLRDSAPSGKADLWDELNHLDENYLEFSMASDILRGLSIWLGVISLASLIYVISLMWGDIVTGEIGGILVTLFGVALLGPIGIFLLRFDLRLPKDCPIRFNRKLGKVYINTYDWNRNPFGRWQGGTKIFEWNTLQAEVTKYIGASGEVVIQRYGFDLVVCRPGQSGAFEEVERFRIQQGAQTIGQYAEQWEFIRRYMNDGPSGLPKQRQRDPNPEFMDSLMFMMPWFAPTEAGRRFRQRHRNPFVVMFLFLMAIPFPLWFIFGLGNYVVMKIAPTAVWPKGLDVESRSSGNLTR